MIRVGFTYDLIDDYLARGFTPEEAAEFDSPETIAAVETSLRVNGCETERVGDVRALTRRLAEGARWDIVFNICEGRQGVGREAQVPALLEAWDVPFVFSSSEVMCLTMDKALAKLRVREEGVPVTASWTSETVPAGVFLRPPPPSVYPLFVKPLAEGTGKGVGAASLATDEASLLHVAADIAARFRQPALAETFLPGRDFTVGIVGEGARSRSLGVMEIARKPGAEEGGQTWRNKTHCHEALDYRPADDAEAEAAENTALQAWRALGCRDGGRVDLRSDAHGVPHFIEVNPLPGLKPGYSDLCLLTEKRGTSHAELIGLILKEALRRYGL